MGKELERELKRQNMYSAREKALILFIYFFERSKDIKYGTYIVSTQHFAQRHFLRFFFDQKFGSFRSTTST
jgi:hypothetical protein